MPRKIKDIKEIASMQSLGNIHDDPAQNSVLGNIKKLHIQI